MWWWLWTFGQRRMFVFGRGARTPTTSGGLGSVCGHNGNQADFFASCGRCCCSGSTETALTSGEWVLQSSSSRVEQLRLSVSIDSSGLAKWWARSEAGDEIQLYETDIYTSGADQLSGYTAPVPTSIRLGSDCDGVGQQAMTIMEVSVW